MPVQGCAFPVVKVRVDRLRENQSLLDDAQSEKLLRDEEERLIKEHEALKREAESPTSFMTPKSATLDPALLFQGEAHSVGGTTVMRYDDVDVDTRLAIGYSVQQLKARLQRPPPEPLTGVTVMVRLPDGKKLQRVFAPEHTLLHLCQWIELDSEVVPPLCSQAYKLKRPYSSFLVCRVEGKVALDGEEVSTVSIGTLLNLKDGDREQLIVSFLS
ncbi:MAG: hypothetical protein KVP17_005061 [Porospora cf. gigantea B]|nr:MAG: hypothetical protein KVP17_005061 [Porospora cf. gigantea B]